MKVDGLTTRLGSLGIGMSHREEVDRVAAKVRSHIAGSVRGSLVGGTRRCKLGGIAEIN